MLRLFTILLLLNSPAALSGPAGYVTHIEDVEAVTRAGQVASEVREGMDTRVPCEEDKPSHPSEKDELALAEALLEFCPKEFKELDEARTVAKTTLEKSLEFQPPSEGQCPLKKCIHNGLCVSTLPHHTQFFDFPDACHKDAGKTKNLKTTYDPRTKEVLAALTMTADLSRPADLAAFNSEKRTTEIRKKLEETGEFVPPPVAETICKDGSNVTLTQYVQMQDGSLAKPRRLKPFWNTTMTDLFSGVGHLHRIGYFHRDIHPGNVLFKNGRARLDDFGLAVKPGENLNQINYHLVGGWPPEAVSGKKMPSDNLLANTDYVNAAQVIFQEHSHSGIDPMQQIWTKFFHEELDGMLKARNTLRQEISNKTKTYNLSKNAAIQAEIAQLRIRLEPIDKAIEIKVRRNQEEQRNAYVQFKQSTFAGRSDPGLQEVVRLLDPDFLKKNEDRRYDPRKVIAQMNIHGHLTKVADLKKKEKKQHKKEEKKRRKSAKNPIESKTPQQPVEEEPLKLGNPADGYR